MPDPTADQPADLLTIGEAAELLRAPVATLRYWRHLGSGPHSFRLGRRVLYRRDDLHAWIAAQRDGARHHPTHGDRDRGRPPLSRGVRSGATPPRQRERRVPSSGGGPGVTSHNP
jgi:excisionase family DNA binding protein